MEMSVLRYESFKVRSKAKAHTAQEGEEMNYFGIRVFNKGYQSWWIDKNEIVFHTNNIDVARAQLEICRSILSGDYRLPPGAYMEVVQFGAE